MTHALLELIGLALTELEKIPDLMRRAQLMEAAADVLTNANCLERAETLRTAAQQLRTAYDAQLSLMEIFSRTP